MRDNSLEVVVVHVFLEEEACPPDVCAAVVAPRGQDVPALVIRF